MEITQIAQAVLLISIAFSVLLMSIGLYNVFKGLANNLNDARRTVQNMAKITDNVIEEQKILDDILYSAKDAVDTVKNGLQIFGQIKNVVTSFISKRK